MIHIRILEHIKIVSQINPVHNRVRLYLILDNLRMQNALQVLQKCSY